MRKNKKTLIASGTMLALSIMLVGGISFAQAEGSAKGQWGNKAPYSISKADFVAKKSGTRRKGSHMDEDDLLEMHAKLFDLSVEELKIRIDSGETFKDIARGLNIDEETIKFAIKKRAIEHIEELLADGHIDEEKASYMIERIKNNRKN